MTDAFEIFLATAPGLEPLLFEEVRTKGFKRPKAVPGGVSLSRRYAATAGTAMPAPSR
jgi:23S rRNA G2445 N2-methylase RlmL